MGASNLLIEEAAQLIARLERRLEQQRANLSRPAQDSEKIARMATKIERMEQGLERLRLYREMLHTSVGRHDERLINERNGFAKQYNRSWRPSRRTPGSGGV